MISIFVCGDVVNTTASFQFIDNRLIEIIKSADYSVCNLEGPVVDSKVMSRPFAIRQHGSTLGSLSDAGFDLLLLANNHICDYGEVGLLDTLSFAKSMGLNCIGAGFGYNDTYKSFVTRIANKTFGFINISTAQTGQFDKPGLKYGYAWMGDRNLDSRIVSLKRKVDFLILFSHVGYEGVSIPLEEIRDLYRHYCELGVDCVIGSHPHVPQGYEMYGESLIFYSLGNFYFPENTETGKEQESFSVLLKFDDGKFDFDIVYHRIVGNYVSLAKQDEVCFSLQELNRMLEPEVYDEIKEQMYEQGFEHYFGLYKWSLSPEKKTIKGTLRRLFSGAPNENIRQIYMKAWLKLTQCETPNYILSHYLNKIMGQ